MDSLLKADIFFLITALAVVFLTALFAVVLIYLIRILRDVKQVSEHLKEEVDSVIFDISRFRARIKREGCTWRSIAEFFGFIKSNKKPKGRDGANE